MSKIEDGGDRLIATSPPGEKAVEWPTMEVVVYTQGWNLDHPAREDGEATAQLHSRVFIDGREIELATGVTVHAKGGDFLSADIHVYPSSVKFVSLTEDEWKALGK